MVLRINHLDLSLALRTPDPGPFFDGLDLVEDFRLILRREAEDADSSSCGGCYLPRLISRLLRGRKRGRHKKVKEMQNLSGLTLYLKETSTPKDRQ